MNKLPLVLTNGSCVKAHSDFSRIYFFSRNELCHSGYVLDKIYSYGNL